MAGAQWLARRGAPLSFIVLMGLRGRRAVERYVQEAQLEAVDCVGEWMRITRRSCVVDLTLDQPSEALPPPSRAIKDHPDKTSNQPIFNLAAMQRSVQDILQAIAAAEDQVCGGQASVAGQSFASSSAESEASQPETVQQRLESRAVGEGARGRADRATLR